MTVTVYSLPVNQCVKCRGVDIAMRRNEVEYTKVMLDEDPEALAFVKSLGYESAPVVVVTEGDEVVDHFGFKVDKIKELKERVAA